MAPVSDRPAPTLQWAVSPPAPLPDTGLTIWLTGLPGSGKTTLASALVRQLRGAGHRAEMLDAGLRGEAAEIGPLDEASSVTVRRLGFVAHLLSRNGIVAVCALVSPYRIDREYVRRLHRGRFVEVHVSSPVEVCARRRSGEADPSWPDRAGLIRAFEPPVGPEVVVPTDRQTVEQSVQAIWGALWRPPR